MATEDTIIAILQSEIKSLRNDLTYLRVKGLSDEERLRLISQLDERDRLRDDLANCRAELEALWEHLDNRRPTNKLGQVVLTASPLMSIEADTTLDNDHSSAHYNPSPPPTEGDGEVS